MKFTKLKHSASGGPEFSVRYCDSFFSKLIGLMFTKELPQEQGIILVEDKESRLNTAIHMFFMQYDITALWLDRNLVVVDKVLAKRWRPMYIPKKPAQYVVELNHENYTKFAIGDQLMLSD